MLKYFFLVLLAGLEYSSLPAQQPPEAQKALRQIYDVLTERKPVDLKNVSKQLQRGAWETLSYLEKSDSNTIDDVHEAVPDYYRFMDESALLLKLINPDDDYNEYGTELVVKYAVKGKNIIELFDPQTNKLKDRWRIIYLDGNYLALEMGSLRVFFTHTPVQE